MQAMNWDDLKFVLAVGRSGTLAGAARGLNVDATTVGRRVSAIEADLGARLFDRTASGYLPTGAGHRALAHAEDIERAAISLSGQIAGSDRRVEGAIRLTGLDATFDRLVIPRLPRLLARHPGLEVTFASGTDIVDLSRREADLAIRDFEPSHPDSVGRRLGRIAMTAYAAKGVEAGDVPPLITLPRESDWTGYARSIIEAFPRGRIAARGSTEGHVLALVRAGIGIGVLDCYLGDSDPDLRRVPGYPVATRTMWAECHVAMARAPRILALIRFLGEIFQEESALLSGGRPGSPGSCAPAASPTRG